MARNIGVIVALNSLTIAFGWVIYLAGIPPSTSLFIFAAESVLIIGLLSLIVTFLYVFMGYERNKFFWPAIGILVIGIALTFLWWFLGGIVVLVSLLLLLLSKSFTLRYWRYITLTFIGFLILSIVPPVEAMLNTYSLSMDYTLIIIASVMIVIGLYLFSRKSLDVEGNLIYIIMAMSFFLLPPYHEIFGIKNNGSYGMYDTAIIMLSTITFVIFLVGLLYASERQERALREIERGYANLKDGKWEDACKIFKGLSMRGYKDDRIFNGMGVALMHMGNFDDAEVFLKEAIKIKNNDTYLTNLGNVYYRRGDTDKAMKIYSKVLKRNPNCYLALNNMGRALLKKGDKEEAEKYLKRAIEVNPRDEIAKKNYSLINGK
jgi:Flp pilus assembly protein TadD